MPRIQTLSVFLACWLGLAAPALGNAGAPPSATQGATAVSQAPDRSGDEPQRPRVALVLSGGGARGLAHIGVLQALRRMRVPVDMVVGTSMGSVVGGAYAAGRNPQELQTLAEGVAWGEVLADKPRRDQLTQRRRSEDVELPSRMEFALGRRGLALPPAVAGNAALEHALLQLLPAARAEQPPASLPLPFRAVASDLLTGEMVVLAEAPLLSALRASLSVPGVFTPLRLQGRLLVDGGLVRNLPIDVARAMGAEIVIAVNLGTSLAPESELGSSLGVAQQMLNILTEQNVQRSLQELRPADILLTPDLAGIGFLDFKHARRAIASGEQAAQKLAPRLAALAVSEELYARLEARRVGSPGWGDSPQTVVRLDVRGTEVINPEALRKQAAQEGLEVGVPITETQVRAVAQTLYGRGDVDRVGTTVRDGPDGRSVVLDVSEAAWTRNRVRLGLELSSDFGSNNSFGVIGMHMADWLNSWGAEWRTVARLGTSRSLESQWWQPLGAGSPWFALGQADISSSDQDIFADGLRVARAGFRTTTGRLALGRELGHWGTVRLGVLRTSQIAELLVPQDPAAKERFAGSAGYVELDIDTLAPIAFPERGWLLQGFWFKPLRSGTPAAAAVTSQLFGMAAFTRGPIAGHVYAEWSHQPGGLSPRALGGFLRLSGTEPLSVGGRTVVLARLVLARRLGELPVSAGGAVRAGLSVEVGNGFQARQKSGWAQLQQAGSAFVSVDTRFGPLYLALGGTRGGSGSVYVFLGPFW
jgi:NTE family protein